MDKFFFDRKGKPIDAYTMGRLMMNMDYKRVVLTFEAGFGISTVWVGIDMYDGFGCYKDNRGPIIFESMVVEGDERGFCCREDLGMWRYATEDEAFKHHGELIAEWINQSQQGMVVPNLVNKDW